MIPKRLEPLLSRLKNPTTEQFNDQKRTAANAIKLIEGGGIGESLMRKFKEDNELELFVLLAAINIDTPSREERKDHWAKWINESFEEVFDKLVEIDDICRDGNIKTCKGDKTFKQMMKVKAELDKLRDIYLSKLKTPKRPDNVDMLMNLFNKYLPEVKETFIDQHIRKMLKPFGIELKPDTVRIRKYRAQTEGKWFFYKGNLNLSAPMKPSSVSTIWSIS